MKNSLKLLLTNDDGYTAKGINALHHALHKHYAVTVVAPEKQQSGIGHAFTYKKPITCDRFDLSATYTGHAVSGTPADCVKFALGHLLPEKPDLVVSGINEGKNTGIASYYSGTIAGAREAAFWGIPAIAFSVCERAVRYLDTYAATAQKIIENVFVNNNGLQPGEGIFYNVNFPRCHPDTCKGLKITKQSLAFYNDVYNQVENKDGQKEYWIEGTLDNIELTDDYDSRAIDNGYITLTPLHFDATAYTALSRLSDLDNVL